MWYMYLYTMLFIGYFFLKILHIGYSFMLYIVYFHL